MGMTNSSSSSGQTRPIEEIIDEQVGIVLNAELRNILGDGGIENG